MISIYIFCRREKDACLLLKLCRYRTALTGDDTLSARVVCDEARRSGQRGRCGGSTFLCAEEVLTSGETPDILLFELEQRRDLSLFTKIRRAFPDACLALLVNPALSPDSYITPLSRPLAVLTRPIDRGRASEVIHQLYAWFYAHRERGPQNLLICRREEKRYFRCSRILYMEAREKKICLHYGREEVSFYGSLKEMETLLPAYFARCHRSYIINAMQIKKMDLAAQCCFLTNDISVPVSKKYKNNIDVLLKKA